MEFTFSSMAALFAALLGIIVICFFLNNQQRNQHGFLIYFLSVLIFIQLYSFVFHSGLMLKVPWLLNINIPAVFLLGPLFYGYVLHLQQKPITSKQWILHLIPFVFVVGYCFNFYLQPAAYKFNIIAESIAAEVAYKPYVKPFPSDPWDLNGWIVVELQCLHLFIYGVVTFFQMYKSQARSKWLILLNFSLIVASVILFLAEGGVINGERFLDNILPRLSNELFAVFVFYAIVVYLMLKPSALTQHIPKYRKSSLNDEWRKKKANDLMSTLERDKLYLSPDLSLQLVADTLGIKKHHLSQVINQELGCTFFELLNRFRIKEAKQVLKKEECKMESLAYQLGYRSKSAFFIAFKKETSQTPGEFARQA